MTVVMSSPISEIQEQVTWMRIRISSTLMRRKRHILMKNGAVQQVDTAPDDSEMQSVVDNHMMADIGHWRMTVIIIVLLEAVMDLVI
jgi:hypothetical protein